MKRLAPWPAPHTPSWPRDLRAPRHAPAALADLLHQRFDRDTWFQAVSCPSWPLSPGGLGATWPRIAKSGLHRIEAEWLADGPRDPEYRGPVLAYAVADLDRPDHAPWTSTGEAEAALEEWGAGPVAVYATRAGLRAVWSLASPVPVAYAQAWLDAWYAAPDGVASLVPAAQLPLLDRVPSDWTRGWRVPWCPRDGEAPPWGDALPPIAFRADAPPLEWWPRGALPHEVQGVDATLPPAPETPEAPAAWRAYVKPDSIVGRVADLVGAGLPFAPAGDRNVGTWRVVSSLATQLDRGAPAPDPQAIFGVLARSVAAQGEPTLPALWSMAVRASRLEAASRAEAAAEHAAATRHALRAAADAEDLGPVVLQVGPSVWVREAATAGYRGPATRTTARAYLRDHPIVVTTPAGKALDWDTIYHRHGHAVSYVEYGYDPDSRWDPERRALLVTAARYVPPAPVRDARVAEWLAALLGESPGDVQDAVLDWVATANDPRHRGQPTSVLYLEGARGVGKGLLAAALSSPWGHAPTPLATAIGPRKAGLLRTPIVFLDEGLTLDRDGTAAFRSLTGERTHEIDEKYQVPVTLLGCVRGIVAANNGRALGISEIDSLADLEAIADRVLHVRVSAAARAALRRWGPPPDAPARIAAHLAWLARERDVRPGSRWVVRGQRTAWHDGLLIAIPRYADALEVVWAGLRARPTPAWTAGPDGSVGVSAAVVHAAWGRFGDPQRKPRLTALAQTLGALSEDGRVSARALGAWVRAVGADEAAERPEKNVDVFSDLG